MREVPVHRELERKEIAQQALSIMEQAYTLRITEGGYSIRIERAGHGQTIKCTDLYQGGINTVMAVCRLIEDRIAGNIKAP